MSRSLPDQKPPVFRVDGATLIAKATRTVQSMGAFLDRITTEITPQSATFENAILPYAYEENELKAAVQYVVLLQAVAMSADLREAASEAVNIIDKADLSTYVRSDFFQLVCAVRQNPVELDNESQLFLDRLYASFIDNGLDLSRPWRDDFHAIQSRLVELRVSFMENLGKYPGEVWKTEDELDGLPSLALEGLERDPQTAKRKICLKKPLAVAVLTFCNNGETRKDVFLRSQSIFSENVPIFKETIELRDKAAKTLRYNSFADRRLARQMAKTPDNVTGMLQDLATKLEPKAQAELHRLEDLNNGDTPTTVHLWDFDYYNNLMLKQQHNIDHEYLSEYYPAEWVIRSMLDCFQIVFGIHIRELHFDEMQHLSPSNDAEDLRWAPEIRMFAVWDNANCGGDFLGYLYTDIYSRAGKYTHAANFNIRPGYIGDDHRRRTVVTSLVCNVSPPANQRPALLRHQEVITIFHELGHAMHDLLSKTRYARFHGHRTSPDFVEAPSQLLEFFCWDPQWLREISLHYTYLPGQERTLNSSHAPERQSKHIDIEVLNRLTGAKNVNSALSTLRQVAFSKFDMDIHGPRSSEALQSMEISATYNRIREEVGLLLGPDTYHWGNGHVVTSHYMWGQEANYYSYLSTRIFAADMFHAVFGDDLLSSEAGQRYRKIILERGGAHDEMKSMIELLGREPDIGASARDIGLVYAHYPYTYKKKRFRFHLMDHELT